MLFIQTQLQVIFFKALFFRVLIWHFQNWYELLVIMETDNWYKDSIHISSLTTQKH